VPSPTYEAMNQFPIAHHVAYDIQFHLFRFLLVCALKSQRERSQLKSWLQLSVLDSVPMTGSIHRYWRKCRVKFDKRQRKTFDGIIIYFWWNIRKERNRRTFQQKGLQANQVASLCKDDIHRYQFATRPATQQE
jgi:hypothetical protein